MEAAAEGLLADGRGREVDLVAPGPELAVVDSPPVGFKVLIAMVPLVCTGIPADPVPTGTGTW